MSFKTLATKLSILLAVWLGATAAGAQPVFEGPSARLDNTSPDDESPRDPQANPPAASDVSPSDASSANAPRAAPNLRMVLGGLSALVIAGSLTAVTGAVPLLLGSALFVDTAFINPRQGDYLAFLYGAFIANVVGVFAIALHGLVTPLAVAAGLTAGDLFDGNFRVSPALYALLGMVVALVGTLISAIPFAFALTPYPLPLTNALRGAGLEPRTVDQVYYGGNIAVTLFGAAVVGLSGPVALVAATAFVAAPDRKQAGAE